MIVIIMTLSKEEWNFQRRYKQMQGQAQGHQTLYIQATKWIPSEMSYLSQLLAAQGDFKPNRSILRRISYL